jgi:hypothetical protein
MLTKGPLLKKSHGIVLSILFSIFVFAGNVFASNLVATSLNNINIGGGASAIASIHFQAKSSAPLAAVRLYWIIANAAGHPGYASGTGGSYVYELRADSNGQPGAVLATASMVRNEITGNQRGNFALICFPPVSLISGKYYDIIVENVDPEPSVNFSSLDFLFDAGTANQTPDVQVWVSDYKEAFKPADAGTFVGSPVALFYADGMVQGHGDIAVGSSYPGGFECGSAYGFPASLCQQ